MLLKTGNDAAGQDDDDADDHAGQDYDNDDVRQKETFVFREGVSEERSARVEETVLQF